MDQNYQNIEHFLTDESFVSWAQGRSDGAGEFWETWAIEHADKAELLEDAKCMVRGIPFVKPVIDQQEIAAQLVRLQEAIGSEAPKISLAKKKNFAGCLIRL